MNDPVAGLNDRGFVWIRSTREFQTLHFDFGLPLDPKLDHDVARYTALHIPSGVGCVSAVTRLVPLAQLLSQRRWPPFTELLGGLIAYGQTHGAWDDARGYVEGSLARVVEGAAASSPRLPSVKSDPGFLCGTEFDSLRSELAFFERHGLSINEVEVEVDLEPGQLLVFDNLSPRTAVEVHADPVSCTKGSMATNGLAQLLNASCAIEWSALSTLSTPGIRGRWRLSQSRRQPRSVRPRRQTRGQDLARGSGIGCERQPDQECRNGDRADPALTLLDACITLASGRTRKPAEAGCRPDPDERFPRKRSQGAPETGGSAGFES